MRPQQDVSLLTPLPKNFLRLTHEYPQESLLCVSGNYSLPYDEFDDEELLHHH